MNKKQLQPECQHCQARFKSVCCDLNEEELNELNLSKGATHLKKYNLFLTKADFHTDYFA